jgi:ribosomal protein S18 acetylase RimI-like enzyme
MGKEKFQITSITKNHHTWVTEKLIEHWGSTRIVTRQRIFDASRLPGFIALENEYPIGLVTYVIEGKECEIITLNSFKEQQGVGSLLLEEVICLARQQNCRRIWLITTNDNLTALGFYQRRDFTIAAVYPNALQESRRLKPEIPEMGMNKIPLRDEIELELVLTNHIS